MRAIFCDDSRTATRRSGADEVRRDVDLLAVDREVAVANELARLGVIAGEAHAVDGVVEAALEELDQHLARDALHAGGLVVVAAELALERCRRCA
jgi:hypothetical protein